MFGLAALLPDNTVYAQYYGYNCGQYAGRVGNPSVDAFDQCCYNHDRCLEAGRGHACSADVFGCMMGAGARSGRPVPQAIIQGFAGEHGLGWLFG